MVYINGLQNLPSILTEKETNLYLQLARNGDTNAKDKLKEHNLRLVVYIANKFSNLKVELEELVGIGTIGLIKAVETFDIEKNTKFATYASRCIENEILMFVRKHKNHCLDISLDEALSNDKDENSLLISDILDTGEDITEEHDNKELYKAIRDSLFALNNIQRQVIIMRIGFGCEKMTERQTAKKLGISQSYVSRVERKAKAKIAEILEKKEFYKLRVTPEMEKISKMSSPEKSIFFARKILEEGFTFENLSLRCNQSITSIKNCISCYLKNADSYLNDELQNLLNERNEKEKQFKLEETIKAQELYDDYRGKSNYTKPKKSSIPKEEIKKEKILPILLPDYSEVQIKKALMKLPDLEREILLLRYPLEEGIQHSLDFIAEQYNINPEFICMKIETIIENLIKILEGKDNEIEKTWNQETESLTKIKKTSKDKIIKQSNKTNLVFDKFPNHTEEQIREALKKLSDLEREILLLRYPLEEGIQHKLASIAEQYNINPKTIKNKIKSIVNKMFKILDGKELKPIKSNSKKQTFKVSKSIFEYFPNHTEEQVLAAISRLNSINKKIIELKYGLNGNVAIDTKKISAIIGLNNKTLSVKIIDIRKQILRRLEEPNKITKRKTITKKILSPQNFFDIYPNYTEEQILKAISQLNEINKRIIELKYGLNGNKPISNREIAILFEEKESNINNRLKYSKKRIKEILSSKVKTILMDRFLLKKFPNYTEEQIKEALMKLSDLEREILLLRYPLEEGIQHKLASIAEQYNINPKTINNKIKSIVSKMIKILDGKKLKTIKSNSKKQNFKAYKSIFEYFPNYSEEQVLVAISQLNSINKKIIELKYGLNGNVAIDTKKISAIIGLNNKTLSVRIRGIRKQILKRLEESNKIAKRKTITKKILSPQNFFDIYPDYTKEKVLEALNMLSIKNKKVIELRYGLNENKSIKIKEIAILLEEKESNIYAILKNSKKRIREILLGKAKRVSKKKTENITKENIKNEIYSFFLGFPEKDVDEEINKLPEKRKTIIELRFGLNGHKKHGIREISKITGYKQKEINIRVEYIIKIIKKQLNDKVNSNSEVLFPNNSAKIIKIQNEKSCESDKLSEYIGDKEITMILK